MISSWVVRRSKEGIGAPCIVVPPLQESQPDLLEQRLYDMFKHRVRQRAYDQNQQLTEDNAIQVTKTVTGIVFDKVGFTGGALMALYACDVKQVRDHP